MSGRSEEATEIIMKRKERRKIIAIFEDDLYEGKEEIDERLVHKSIRLEQPLIKANIKKLNLILNAEAEPK